MPRFFASPGQTFLRVKYDFPFFKKFISCFILLAWPTIFSGFRFYFLQKWLKWAEILHGYYCSQMQMMYQFGGNYFQVISHFLSFCQIFVNYSKHFLNPWHSLTYFAEPCCAFPHLEIPWLVYLAVYWHTLIHPDTTWLSLPSLAQAYQTLPAMEKWLRRPYTMTSTSHPNKNITNYFFISESPFPCWLLMDLTAVNCLLLIDSAATLQYSWAELLSFSVSYINFTI